jgi:Xaa-Pro aminopeptidase
MHRIAAALALVVCLGAAPEASQYRARREAVRKALGDSVLVLFGRSLHPGEEPPGGPDQEPDFYYLTGWTEPGAVLLLTAEGDALFLPKHNPEAERYTGRRLAAADEDARARTGFDTVLPTDRFESELRQALDTHSSVLALTREPSLSKLKSLAPLRQFRDAAPLLSRFRAKKSAWEIERIQHATDVSVEAHRAAWRRIAPGLFEFQVAATLTGAALEAGCEGNAYSPIVGSGVNATVLHYSKNSRRMEAGELVLIDAAAQCSDYASDITRTAPVSGRFSPRQRELYEIVLGAQRAALAAVKPGATLAELNKIAREYLDTHGTLGKYLTHRISHGIGLEVHDDPTADYTGPLEAGMVISIEPGLYIPEENIGIRIEDTVLVTSSGARVMSGALAKEPAEIEKAMAK